MKHLDTDVHPPARLQLCSLSAGSSSSSSQPVLNPQLFQLFNSNAQRAASVANKPFEYYQGEQTAGMTPTQQYAGGLLTNGAMTAGSDALNSGVSAAQGAANYQAPQVTAPTSQPGLISSTATANPASINRSDVQNLAAQTGLGNLSQYMNPYTDSVVNSTLSDIDRQRQQSITQGQGNATLAGAYGGSRHGVSDSLTNEAAIRAAGDASAQLRSAGFNAAAGLLQNDQNRALTAGQSNQNADLSVAGQNAGYQQQGNQFNANAQNASNLFNAGNQQATNLANQQTGMQGLLANQNASLAGQGINLQGAGLLNNLGNSQASNFLNATNAINQYGTQEQNTQQSALTAAYQEFMRQQNYDPQMQQLINQALGMVPTGLGQSSSGSSSNFGLSLAGLGGK